jgi:hypothetical protein
VVLLLRLRLRGGAVLVLVFLGAAELLVGGQILGLPVRLGARKAVRYQRDGARVRSSSCGPAAASG